MSRGRTVTAIALGIVTVCGLAFTATNGNAATMPPRYTGPPVVGPENITFLYHSIPETTAAGQLSAIGHPRDIVFGTTNDARVPGAADEPAYAHSIGARAFKYAQFTWFPSTTRSWSGTTATQRAGWALCKSGDTALTDAKDGDDGGAGHGTVAWDYADANERSFVDAMLAWTGQLKALGYDGVFIDAAGRATRGPFWRIKSTCTSDPVAAGIRSSDAWFNLLMRIKAQGLKVAAMNIGAPSAVDPFVREDPNNPKRTKSDVAALEWVMHENAGKPSENYPGKVRAARVEGTPFETLAAWIGNDARNGRGKVVEMAKARLPLDDPERYRQEEYTWSLAKLSGGPVVLNAGYDFCGVPAGTTDCNRTGLSRPLTDIRLGTPLDATAYPAACNGAGCMWVRRFERGLVVVSGYGSPKRVATIPTGLASCRRITAFQGGQQAKGACVTSLPVSTGSPRWSHVYLYTR